MSAPFRMDGDDAIPSQAKRRDEDQMIDGKIVMLPKGRAKYNAHQKKVMQNN